MSRLEANWKLFVTFFAYSWLQKLLQRLIQQFLHP
jgi:hypothetical protein